MQLAAIRKFSIDDEDDIRKTGLASRIGGMEA
jgi:hypothetical protein